MMHDELRGAIDQEILGGLEAGRRGALHDHLRSCEHCRDYYDDGMLAMRELEGADDLSGLEIDLVETWLFDPAPAKAPQLAAWWRRPLTWVGAAMATVAVVLFLVLPGDGTREDELIARGGAVSGGLGLQVLCGDPLRAAEESGCRLDETMTFAYRLAPGTSRGRLLLFGVDGHGDTLYYAPTPLDPTTIDAEVGEWTSVPLSIGLGVNHEVGQLTVYGLVTTNAVTVAAVDAWAAALRGRAPARVGDEAWPGRLAHERLAGTCEPTRPGSCRAAEVSLQLHEADR